MKKLGFSLLLLFFLAAAFYAVVQSSIGKNWIRNTLTSRLQESGFEVQIGQVEGTLPHQIDLKEVSIQGNGLNMTLSELRFRPVLWRLLKKEIALNDVQAKEVSIKGSQPFDFNGKVRANSEKVYARGTALDWKFTFALDQQTKQALFRASNNLLQAKGKIEFGSHLEFLSSTVQIGSTHLPFSAAGRVLAHVHIDRIDEEYKLRANWQIPNLIVEGTKIGRVKGNGEALFKEGTLKGFFTADPYAKATFDLTLTPDQRLIGTTHLDIDNLQSLHIPNAYGKIGVKATWTSTNQVQGLHLDGSGTNLYYGPLFAEKLSVYSDLTDPFHEMKGLFDIEAEKLKWNHLELDAASFQTAIGDEAHPFQLFAEGTLRHPFELHADGTWKEPIAIQIENCNGTFLQTPFELEQPVLFEQTEDLFRIPKAQFKIGDAKAYFNIDRQKNQTDAQIRFDQLPLDFLSFNPLEVQVGGTLDLDAVVRERNDKLQGKFKALIHQVKPFDANGSFEGSFDANLLDLKGTLAVHESPLLNLDLSLPIHLSVWPFEAELLFHKEAKGDLAFHGRVEEFLDFLDIGPHRLEGDCHCDLQLKNTLYRPTLEGKILFENGYYENYYSGTLLTQIKADLFAKKNILYLRSLTAQDPTGVGTLSATGELKLLQSDLYPFQVDATFANLKFVEIDLVNATADGTMHIEGNALSALAKGDVFINQCELLIPDHIPRPLPNLDVVYRNSIHPVAPMEASYKPYPLHLDLHVLAPTNVSISGRGLSSEWKGDFQLGGTVTSLAAKGKLELIEGEFNFSGRSFKLIDGALTLSGIEHQMPHLNLAATTDTNGVLITARLKGPIDDPQITLQSSPPLPLGSIMSYLLFGQDISEIGGFQALQIASSLASLAGTGPDIMESTRRSLGVDRLRVITDPNAEGGETVALQVGKYVAKGVLVSFTQGTEDSSPNISVEVELKSNFSFQVESDQRQEQGKFTLKWNLNY